MEQNNTHTMAASTITAAEFKTKLNKYEELIQDFVKPPKDGQLSLLELDKFRYEIAPINFSKNTGRTMKLEDVQKLVDWKIRHGTFRPTLPKLVASNNDEKVAAAAEDAFSHYASYPSDIATVIDKLSKPLKGIGPATASLFLAVHDPSNVVFFSDELYRWLCHNGEKVSPKYTVKEFEEIFSLSKAFMARLKCTPIEVEKVAFVIIKENEPKREAKPAYVPSGKPRGRPSKPDSEKLPKKTPVPGRGRGRPPGVTNTKTKTNGDAKTSDEAPKKRGRPALKTSEITKEEDEAPPKKRGRPSLAASQSEETEENIAPKKRGRPSLATSKHHEPETNPAPKKRGRPSLAKSESHSPDVPRKRGRPSLA